MAAAGGLPSLWQTLAHSCLLKTSDKPVTLLKWSRRGGCGSSSCAHVMQVLIFLQSALHCGETREIDRIDRSMRERAVSGLVVGC